MVRVSVIISVYSKARLGYLLNCIESLRRQSVKPDEIIVVLDHDLDLIEFYRSKLVEDMKVVVSEKYGLSNARNAGLRNANGDIVAFIDDDAVADKHWLEFLVKNYDDAHVVGVGGLVKPIWERNRPVWFPEELDWIVGCSYKGLPERKTCVRNPIGCNMSFRRGVFERVGYFRADIGRLGKKPLAGEEAELSLRILEEIPGSKIVHDQLAVVYHMVPEKRAQLGYMMERSFYEGFSKAIIAYSRSSPLNALSTEERYLKYLLKAAIPSRLRRFHKSGNICHVITLLMSMCLFSVGYFAGLLSKSRLDKDSP